MEQGGQIHVPTGVVRGRLRGGLSQFSTLGQSQSHGWCPGWLARDSGEPVVESKNNNAYVSNPNYVSGSVFLPPHPQPHPPPTGSPVLDSIHTVPSLHQGKSSHLCQKVPQLGLLLLLLLLLRGPHPPAHCASALWSRHPGATQLRLLQEALSHSLESKLDRADSA